MKIDYSKHIGESLQNPKFLKNYLTEAIEDKDPKILLIVLMQIIKSKPGGMSACSNETGISRQTLYNSLCYKGNPKLNTLKSILKYIGFRLSIKAIEVKK